MRGLLRGSLLGAVLALCAATPPAHAEDSSADDTSAEKRGEARRLLEAGKAAFRAKDYGEAARLFLEAYEADSSQMVALYNRAFALRKAKRYGDAAKHWEKAVELSGGCPEIVQNVGRLVHVNGKQITMPKSVYQDIANLYAKLATKEGSIQHSERIGWLYMLPRPEDIGFPLGKKRRARSARLGRRRSMPCRGPGPR